MHYETILESEKIVETLERLEARIHDRFPNADLKTVCGKLKGIALKAQQRSIEMSQPVVWLRVLTIIFCLVLVAITVCPFFFLHQSIHEIGHADFIQILDSGINVVVLIGAALFFLVSLETRYKRRRALRAIHELRSIAHIIDMHQLTKDPERLISHKFIASSLSPKISMTRFELQRYLDYCSEMLSLTGKVAAVYVQRFDDSVALGAASEVEAMASGLSRKIWQKILILHSIEEPGPRVLSVSETKLDQ